MLLLIGKSIKFYCLTRPSHPSTCFHYAKLSKSSHNFKPFLPKQSFLANPIKTNAQPLYCAIVCLHFHQHLRKAAGKWAFNRRRTWESFPLAHVFLFSGLALRSAHAGWVTLLCVFNEGLPDNDLHGLIFHHFRSSSSSLTSGRHYGRRYAGKYYVLKF